MLEDYIKVKKQKSKTENDTEINFKRKSVRKQDSGYLSTFLCFWKNLNYHRNCKHTKEIKKVEKESASEFSLTVNSVHQTAATVYPFIR